MQATNRKKALLLSGPYDGDQGVVAQLVERLIRI